MDNKSQIDNKELLNKKVYIIKKDEDFNDILDVKEYFEKEDKFLCLNPKISIGLLNKKNNKNKIEENNLLPSLGNQISKPRAKSRYSISSFYNSQAKSPKKDGNSNVNILSYRNKNLKINIPISNDIKQKTEKNKNLTKNIHYKYSSFNDLKKIFINSYEREKNSKKKGTNDLIPLKTDINVKKKYYSQGKKLNLNSIYKSNSEKYIKFLAKKCKKKENDMLMNNIPNYRMKKQIKEYIENNKLLSEKFGNNFWLFSLRRPPKNDYTRFDFFNIGTSEREIWKSFTDYPDKDYELINFPYRKGKNSVPLYTEIYNDQIPKIDEYEDIKIEGKNLVKKEYDDIVNAYNTYNDKNNKIVFKLYKDPKENDRNYVKDLICKEIYQTKKRKNKEKEIQKIKFNNLIKNIGKSNTFNISHSVKKIVK